MQRSRRLLASATSTILSWPSWSCSSKFDPTLFLCYLGQNNSDGSLKLKQTAAPTDGSIQCSCFSVFLLCYWSITAFEQSLLDKQMQASLCESKQIFTILVQVLFYRKLRSGQCSVDATCTHSTEG